MTGDRFYLTKPYRLAEQWICSAYFRDKASAKAAMPPRVHRGSYTLDAPLRCGPGLFRVDQIVEAPDQRGSILLDLLTLLTIFATVPVAFWALALR